MAIDGGSVEIRFEGDVAPLRRSVEEVVENLEDVKQAVDNTDKSLSSSFDGFGKKTKAEFEEFADGVTDAFTRAIDSSDEFILNIKSIGSALKNIGFGALTAGATAATKSLVKMAKGAISDTSALENVQIQMIGLTDSVEKGNKAMAMAVQYFKSHPFNRFEVTNATKSLIQFGAELDEIPTLLDKMGKVALSTGQSIETIAYYYQRNISDGRVATRDLLQMQQSGIPIFGALAKQIGATSGAVRELAAQGKISIEDFQKAFDSLVSDEAMERFNETLSRQLDRFKGRLSNMRAALAGYSTSMEEGLLIDERGLYRSWTRLVRTFADIMDSETGQRIYEGFTKIGKAISGIIDQITKMLEPAMNLASKALNFLGDNSELIIPLLGGLAVALGKLGSNLPVIGDLIKGVNNNFGKLYTGIKNIVSTHPLLSAFVTLLGVGFMEAYKNDEKFRKTIVELGEALREVFSNLMEAVRGVLPVFVNLIKELASSGVIKGILQTIAGALKIIAQAIASIPPEALAGLMSFILSLKLLNANPIMFAVTAITLLIQYLKELGGIGKFFENLPENLKTIGHNLMTGLFNGIKEGATKVFNLIKQIATSVVDAFKNMWGIHSPSTVGYDLGYNLGLGVAGGISDSSDIVQVAMNNLAEDILKLSEKILSNKVSFGLLNVKEEYQEWKKISRLFTQGSEQYNYAIEKMEEARKNANLQILNLQKTYNNALDTTIKKISSMYGIFDSVNLGGGKNSGTILKNLDQQVSKMQEWASAQEIINNLGLDPALVEELRNMGVDSVAELSSIANMTASELSDLNELWLKKQSIANEAGVRQMEGLKNDTLDQINDLKKGIDGTTVDIADVGGRLVESISEGVYGAMPTLEGAMSQLGDYIEKARKQLAKQVGGTDTLGEVGDEIKVPDTGKVLKEEIQASMDKLKSMLPNILLGAISAWGAFKFGPKILKAIADKLFMKGGLKGNTLASILGTMGQGNSLKDGLIKAVDYLFGEMDEGSTEQAIISKIQDKLKGVDFSSTAEEAAKKMKKVSKPAESIAKSTQAVTSSVETTGKSMNKASSWMNSIQQGAKTVIYIAGAIAAVAGALWITYNALKDVDFKKLTEELAMMTIAVGAFGALAWAADKLQVSWKGVLAIIGVAVDIAAVSKACASAYNSMKDIPWDGFGNVLGQMASAIGVFGIFAGIFGIKPIALAEALGLAVIAGIAIDIASLAEACRGAYETMKHMDYAKWGEMLTAMKDALSLLGGWGALLGLFAPLEGLGWLSIMAICDELIKTSNALYEVYTKVPEDLPNVRKKIEFIKEVLVYLSKTDLGQLIQSIIASLEVGPLVNIVENYRIIAGELEKLSQINIDQTKVLENLGKVKEALDLVKSETDFISGYLQSWADNAEADSVESAGRIIITYGKVVDSLNKLSELKLDSGIKNGIDSVAAVVQYILASTRSNSDFLVRFFTGGISQYATDVEKIGEIAEHFVKMVPTFNDLAKSENQISNTVKGNVESNVQKIKDIVLEIGSVDTGGWVEQKEIDVGKIQSILNKFTELIPVVNQISTMNIAKGDAQSGAIKRIKDVKELVKEIGSVDTAGWVETKENDVRLIQSILNKFTELAQTTHLLDKPENQIAGNAKQWVMDIRNLVWEIGQINTSQSKDMSAKESIVESATSLAQKLATFSETLKGIENPVQKDLAEGLVSTVNTLVDGLSNNLSEKVGVFENLGVNLAQSLAQGVGSQEGSMDGAGQKLQSAFWWAIQNRMEDEYWQGRAMGERFRQGLYDVDYGNSGWWAVQGFINGAWGRAGSGDGVYHTGWWIADRFLRGLKDRGGEGSPWKTTIESGVWAGEGLIEGLKSSETAIVSEATSLADQVVEALTLDNLTMSPTLDVQTNSLAPSMVDSEYGIVSGSGGVTINNEVTAYTPYDVEQISRDMAWQLAKV